MGERIGERLLDGAFGRAEILAGRISILVQHPRAHVGHLDHGRVAHRLFQLVVDGIDRIGLVRRILRRADGQVLGRGAIRLVARRFGVVEFGGDAELPRELDRQVQARGDAREVGRLGRTVLIEVVQRKAVVGHLAAAVHRKVGRGGKRIPGNEIQPVGIAVELVEIFVGTVVEDVLLVGQRPHALLVVVAVLDPVPHGVLHQRHVLRTVEQRNRLGIERKVEFLIEGEDGLMHSALLGGDQQHAVGRTGAPERGGRRIFEDLDRLDVVRRDIEQGAEILHVGIAEVEILVDVVVLRNAVDHDQRFVAGVQRRQTADTDRGDRTGIARRRHDVEIGHSALNHLVDGGYAHILELRHVEKFGSRTEVLALDALVVLTHDLALDDDGLDRLGILFQTHVVDPLPGIGDLLGDIAHETRNDGQLLRVGGHAQNVFALNTRYGSDDNSLILVLQVDRGARQHALAVRHDTAHRIALLLLAFGAFGGLLRLCRREIRQQAHGGHY